MNIPEQSSLAILDRITQIVRSNENYVPRPHGTVGGMWTVDTWQVGDLTYQIMDEGWTSVLRAPGLILWSSGSRPIWFECGDHEALVTWLAKLASQ